MFEFRLAYRHDNGEIEGFMGSGLTKEAAESKCFNLIQSKLFFIEKKFKKEQVIKSFDGLTKEEKKQIQEDWKINVKRL